MPMSDNCVLPPNLRLCVCGLSVIRPVLVVTGEHFYLDREAILLTYLPVTMHLYVCRIKYYVIFVAVFYVLYNLYNNFVKPNILSVAFLA